MTILDDFEGYWKVTQYFAPISGAACWNNWVCLFDFLLISNSPRNMSLSPWLGLLQWNRRLSSLRPFSIITAAVWSLHSCMWDSICRVFWKRNNCTTVCFLFSFSGKTEHFQRATSFPLPNDHSKHFIQALKTHAHKIQAHQYFTFFVHTSS